MELESGIHPVRSLGSEIPKGGNEKIVKESVAVGVKTPRTSSGVQGLAHISEFGTEAKMRSELELGKDYDFKILLVDPKEHRMSLGMMRSDPALVVEG